VSRCRPCGASIVWATTVNGKAMPVDVEPAENGNVRLTYDPDHPSKAPRAEVLGPLEQALEEGPLHMPHHATCPSWGTT
jgi:hypothetical protein